MSKKPEGPKKKKAESKIIFVSGTIAGSSKDSQKKEKSDEK